MSKAGAVIDGASAATGRFHCEDCGLFLKNAPTYTEYDAGVDEEWEFGQAKYGGSIIRTGWETLTEVRVCTFCGYGNKREGEIER